MADDGGPAYPSDTPKDVDGHWVPCFEPGMSLRDHYAGLVLPWVISHYSTLGERAIVAYNMADAMITEKRRREADSEDPT